MRTSHRFAALLAAVALSATVTAPGAQAAKRTTKAKAKVTTRKATTTAKAPAATAPATTSAPATTAPPLAGTINVFAAASLTASFTEMKAAFEKANPGVKVTTNFAASPTLLTQIRNGAPADIYASADTANMNKAVEAKLVDGTPQIFTRNRLMIVVPRGNPLRVKTLADLARPEVFVGLGAIGVPAGDYSRQILARAGVEVKPKSLEPSVPAIVNKAAHKEIDAGIVYVTDVAIDEYRVDGVAIPDEQNIIATYPIATVAGSQNKAAAGAFIAFVLSPAGQSIMKKYKFQPLT